MNGITGDQSWSVRLCHVRESQVAGLEAGVYKRDLETVDNCLQWHESYSSLKYKTIRGLLGIWVNAIERTMKRLYLLLANSLAADWP